MAKLLAPKTVNAIRQYIDEGVPLEDCDMSNVNRERVRICEQVYERLQQDPMLDINRCLMRTFGRSKDQVAMDKQVIDMFLETLDEPSRKVMMFRTRKVAESLVRMGQQTGDGKWMDKGLTHLSKLDRLYEEEVQQEDVRNTANLPPTIVNIEVINPERQSISEEEFKRLTKKYGGKEDDFSKLVALRKRRFDGEDMNILALGLDDDE